MTVPGQHPTSAVLMAVYGKDDPTALTSALEAIGPAQTRYPDLVCIVLDGPVSDVLRRGLENFRATHWPALDILELPTNQGLSSALRAGVEHLRGRFDYIIRTDADDLSRPERIAEQINYMEAHPEVGLASSQVEIFEGTPDNRTGRRFLPPGDDLEQFARSRTPINHSAAIFRMTALMADNYPVTRLPFEDWWISLRLVRSGWKIGVIDRVHLDFRGGADMIARRRGLKYARQEINFFRHIHGEGLMPAALMVRNLTQRLVLRMLPTSLMKALYAQKMHR
jgi:glycosyltransferase involved in cell wall biosynthesis